MYTVDPPEAPIEDRKARNIRPAGPLIAQEDYRFKVTMIWDPPAYKYKDVKEYIVKLSKENSNNPFRFDYVTHGNAVSWLDFY